MTCNNKNEDGFSLIEAIVALVIVTIATAATVPVITRNRWQVDVDRYTTQLETGLYALRAKLGSRKTSCSITFPEGFNFLEPKQITEFSKGENSGTDFKCCDSEIAKLIDDPECLVEQDAYKISDITGRLLDNLRLVQTESTPESKNVRIAFVSTKEKTDEDKTDFGFTPPGTTAEAGSLAFLICHKRSISESNPTTCIDNQNKLSIRCITIDGTGTIERGTWITSADKIVKADGYCKPA